MNTLRCTRLMRFIRSGSSIQFSKYKSNAATSPGDENKFIKANTYKTEDNLTYLEDPDTFGTLTRSIKIHEDKLGDEDDVKEQQYLENAPLISQKLTIKQYSDLIKQYVTHKRLKEAIDVLEVRMLTVDRVKPENYIYNILIGACADVGYTKKAFKLFNDMKRRSLKPTGDTYTCLFEACANSPWAADGLKNAQHLRTLMIEKGIEPNLTNYNAMIKAFGRCGDVATAFQIVDEMVSKKIKIRVHTFNHLLHACIADKNTGLRHALVVWRKMLKAREKPNLYSFNLMLRCVKDCNLGTQNDIEELIGILKEHIVIAPRQVETLQISSTEIENTIEDYEQRVPKLCSPENSTPQSEDLHASNSLIVNNTGTNDENNIHITIYNKNTLSTKAERTLPNLLSKVVQMQHVLALQVVHTVQDKFAVVGGQEDFMNEMRVYSVTPDIKTFTQMLPLLDNTEEAENKLLEAMKSSKVKADIDFYNLLIKKRCLRGDHDGAFAVKEIIAEENKARKKIHPAKKKIQLKFNIMTYGVLAMACTTKESAEKLLNDMKENQLKVNIEILGTLLRKGTFHMKFDYVLYIMNLVKEENLKVNELFVKHLETFSEKCASKIEAKKEHPKSGFVRSYKQFLNVYATWLKEVNIEDALKPEHPWEQFKENYPETVQHSNVVIKEPKRFYKKNRRSVIPYKARL